MIILCIRWNQISSKVVETKEKNVNVVYVLSTCVDELLSAMLAINSSHMNEKKTWIQSRWSIEFNYQLVNEMYFIPAFKPQTRLTYSKTFTLVNPSTLQPLNPQKPFLNFASNESFSNKVHRKRRKKWNKKSFSENRLDISKSFKVFFHLTFHRRNTHVLLPSFSLSRIYWALLKREDKTPFLLLFDAPANRKCFFELNRIFCWFDWKFFFVKWFIEIFGVSFGDINVDMAHKLWKIYQIKNILKILSRSSSMLVNESFHSQNELN